MHKISLSALATCLVAQSLPLISSGHKWISEGFASYYQNILMARAGRYTPSEAWKKLYEGFERALALLADIELRSRSGGSESLDRVLDQLQQCCLPSDRTWSGPELFARLDSFIDEPVFMPLYRRHADTVGFPDMHHGGPELLALDIFPRLRGSYDTVYPRAIPTVT